MILLMTSLELHTNLSKCTSTRIPSPATVCRVKTNILLFSVCLREKRHVAMERSITDIVVGLIPFSRTNSHAPRYVTR